MANIRIHEIAKELQADAKEILAFVNENGMEAKTVQKSLEPEMEERVRKAFGRKAEETDMYLLNTPMVPKTSAEPIYARTAFLSFVCLLIVFLLYKDRCQCPKSGLDNIYDA